MNTLGPLLTGSYHYGLVALSIFIAILASYAALDLAGRVTHARGRARFLWLVGGASAMGAGIWCMHYVGMLAFRLPVPVQYDWPTVALSLLAAVVSSGVALLIVSRPSMGLPQTIIGSILIGGGIAAMHYIGMGAMRLPAMCVYSPALVVLSVVLAVVIAFVALWLTFASRARPFPSCITSAWLPSTLRHAP
jgi:two-component system, sensor histidine kinase and response regulator